MFFYTQGTKKSPVLLKADDMITKKDILEECEKVLKDSQFLVDITEKNNNNFTVYVDDYNGLSIGECQRINKQISLAFNKDIEDYSLEVSSPGLDKPFKVREQYIKNIKKQVEVLFKNGEKITGILEEVNNESIKLEVKTKHGNKNVRNEQEIEFKNIKSVKIIVKI